MLKMRPSRDRLIFNMGILILVRRHLHIGTAPMSFLKVRPSSRDIIAIAMMHVSDHQSFTTTFLYWNSYLENRDENRKHLHFLECEWMNLLFTTNFGNPTCEIATTAHTTFTLSTSDCLCEFLFSYSTYWKKSTSVTGIGNSKPGGHRVKWLRTVILIKLLLRVPNLDYDSACKCPHQRQYWRQS